MQNICHVPFSLLGTIFGIPGEKRELCKVYLSTFHWLLESIFFTRAFHTFLMKVGLQIRILKGRRGHDSILLAFQVWHTNPEWVTACCCDTGSELCFKNVILYHTHRASTQTLLHTHIQEDGGRGIKLNVSWMLISSRLMIKSSFLLWPLWINV